MDGSFFLGRAGALDRLHAELLEVTQAERPPSEVGLERDERHRATTGYAAGTDQRTGVELTPCAHPFVT